MLQPTLVAAVHDWSQAQYVANAIVLVLCRYVRSGASFTVNGHLVVLDDYCSEKSQTKKRPVPSQIT